MTDAPRFAVDIRRDGDDLCSRSGAVSWRTTIPRGQVERAFRSLCCSEAGRFERDLHLDLRRLLGSVLVGDPDDPGTPAAALREGPLGAGLALRLDYEVEEGPGSWQVPFEAALIPWADGAITLTTAGVALVQAVAGASPTAPVTLPPRPAVALLTAPAERASSLFTDFGPALQRMRSSLTGLLATDDRYEFHLLDVFAGREADPPRLDALHVLAHGQPGTVLLLTSLDGAAATEVRSRDVGNWCVRRQVALAVLTVCRSAEGVAQELRRSDVGVVVAFRGDLMADVVDEITTGIWEPLAAGGDVDEVVLALRRSLEARDEAVDEEHAWSAASLVVLHDQRSAEPFAESHRAGQAGRQARRRAIDDEVLDGLRWRLDAGCSLDRGPGTVVVVDRSGGDLAVALSQGEMDVAGYAADAGIPTSVRRWTPCRADRPPPDGDGPKLVTIKADASVNDVIELWQDRIGGERLVFQVAGAAEAGGGVIERARRLAASLRTFDPGVVLVERLPEAHDPDAAIPPVVDGLIARLEAGDLVGDEITALPVDLLGPLAQQASLQLDGPARAAAERVVCVHLVGAERWLASCIRQNLPWPEPDRETWGPDVLQARRCLTVAWIRLGRPAREAVWSGGPGDPTLEALVDLASDGRGRIPTDGFVSSAPLTELVVGTELAVPWDELSERDVPKAGFRTLASALPPSVSAVRLMAATERWGWTPS